MSPSPSNLDTLVIDLPFPGLKPPEVPRVKIYKDSTGGVWKKTYIPLSPDAANQLKGLYEAGHIELDVDPLPEEDFRAVEMAWLRAHMEELTQLYLGEWLAIDGPELVAHAGNLPDLLRQASDAGHPNPFITAIPAEPVLSLHL